MNIRIAPPWNSMDEMPQAYKNIFIAAYSLTESSEEQSELVCVETLTSGKSDWEQMKKKIGCHDHNSSLPCFNYVKSRPIMWCYSVDLVAAEFRKMIVKSGEQK